MSTTTLDEAMVCVKALRDRLIAYATEDGIAQGYGCGCMSSPDDYIKREVEMADAMLKAWEEA